ncbi:DUF6538 domain-containing protein [Fulvimarina sp. 2208YS6-2-32]|uniref:DUF6538 domain-containing protein n=1 Tax=Fulvimarina uroteuthidis TaxID=3098149 RepID=A0ABU5I0G0_9HYPH|nr:DUF6538 domain-containing protein [Fulvimarina sp. 2208YS6-2-32]MDY8108701.1 DUF6538 domain-containing protein [Fulvimarina sp. 2208YS6-2-32]
MMAIGSNLERRGAVYYWRKRIPEFLARRIGANQLRYSLGTKDLAAARYLGAGLNAKAAELMLDERPEVTKQQLAAVFMATLKAHKRKLSILADLSRNDPTFDIEEEAREETAMGYSYKLLSRYGAGVANGSKVQTELSEVGLDAPSIEAVCNTLQRMKENGQHRPSQVRIAEAMKAAGIMVSAATMARVEPVYLRALGEALLDTKSRYEDEPIDFGTLISSLTEGETGVSTPLQEPADASPEREGSSSVRARSKEKNHLASYADEPRSPEDWNDASRCEARMSSNVRGDSRKDPAVDTIYTPSIDPVALKVRWNDGRALPVVSAPANVADDIDAIGAKLIAGKVGEKEDDREWDEKTVRQARMIFDLFARFLAEERDVASLAGLAQADLDAFDGFLRTLYKSYGKSPADKTRSIAELRSVAGMKPADERGLSGQTRNRHLTFIGQLLRRAKASGLKLDRDLDLSEFRAKKSKRGRDDRPVPKLEQIEGFFRSPIFTGCRDWDDIHREGPLTFHRAAYFGPLLGNYQGMRREEYCGLAVADIVSDVGDNPFLIIEKNEFRRIKNDQSKRSLALHPELIRLGFLEYVKTIRALGYDRLFPDLHSPSTSSPLGDRLYDEILPALKASGFTPHQSRHFFNNSLKHSRVAEELRADLMGHGGKSETTERYCDPASIAMQLEDIAKLPIVTAHLERMPIRLVSWVDAKQSAPWGRPRRRKN